MISCLTSRQTMCILRTKIKNITILRALKKKSALLHLVYILKWITLRIVLRPKKSLVKRALSIYKQALNSYKFARLLLAVDANPSRRERPVTIHLRHGRGSLSSSSSSSSCSKASSLRDSSGYWKGERKYWDYYRWIKSGWTEDNEKSKDVLLHLFKTSQTESITL